jgi:hypothetical protein
MNSRQGIESELRHWELGYERNLVDRLLDDSGSKRAVLGVDDTLVGLQEGLARDPWSSTQARSMYSSAQTAAGQTARRIKLAERVVGRAFPPRCAPCSHDSPGAAKFLWKSLLMETARGCAVPVGSALY